MAWEGSSEQGKCSFESMGRRVSLGVGVEVRQLCVMSMNVVFSYLHGWIDVKLWKDIKVHG